MGLIFFQCFSVAVFGGLVFVAVLWWLERDKCRATKKDRDHWHTQYLRAMGAEEYATVPLYPRRRK